MTQRYSLTRRRLLRYGAGGAASLVLAGAAGLSPALADVISDAEVTPSGPTTQLPAREGPFRIGFANGFSGNSWRAMAIRALELEAEQHDDLAELIIVDGQNDITKQVNDIESLISQQVDAILLIANSGSAVVPALRAARSEGIVVAPFNLPIDTEDYDLYVGTDPSVKGAASGAWLREALGGRGKIIALGGIAGNSYTAAGWAGALEAFEGTEIEVLAFRDTDWSEDRAKVITADLIAAYPEIDGIWADGGQVTAGASSALQAAGRPLVPVTGDDYNGLLKLYDAERENEPRFDIGLISEPTWQSALALRNTLSVLRGEAQSRDQTITPQLITSDNYQDYIRPELPDQVFVDTNLSGEDLLAIFS